MAVSTIDPNGLNVGQLGGTRNVVINGGMVLSQRYGTASQSPAPNGYGIDRWRTDKSGTGTWSIQQSTDAPSGFSNSALLTVTSSSTPSGSNYYQFQQRVEGYNIVSFGWGASGAKDVTLSFWVKSSVTGTYGGSLRSAALDYSYVFNYTINSANTWEYKTVNISGPTVSTWNSTNGIGIYLMWSLGEGGSNATSTVGSWVSGSYHSSTGATNLIATNSATWQITGVQLEASPSGEPTPFEHRSYGEELSACMRFYQQWNAVEVMGAGIWYGSGQVLGHFPFKHEMRTAPTITVSSAAFCKVYYSVGTIQSNDSGSPFDIINSSSARINIGMASSGASPGGQGALIQTESGAAIYVDAEL